MHPKDAFPNESKIRGQVAAWTRSAAIILLLAGGGANGQPVLEATLKPTIGITAPLGSVQEVQAASSPNTNDWTTLGFVHVNSSPAYFTDTAAGAAKRFYRSITVGLEDTNLAWIPPGRFVMGSPTNEVGRATSEGPQTTVTLTRGFLMGRFEVRNFDYIQIMGATPVDDSSLSNYLARPVRKVTWVQATNYCALRTVADFAAGKIPAGWAYRLPTEAEWEYACRAGTTNAFYYGNELRSDKLLGVQAIFNGNYPYPPGALTDTPVAYTAPQVVGQLMPNAFGLYDMHGNESEWCLDNFTSPALPAYPGGSVTNYVFAGGPIYAIVRGGWWVSHGEFCRSAARSMSSANQALGDETGFRVVLAPQ